MKYKFWRILYHIFLELEYWFGCLRGWADTNMLQYDDEWNTIDEIIGEQKRIDAEAEKLERLLRDHFGSNK